MADDSNDLDPVVKPQDDTQEKFRNINVNNVCKVKSISSLCYSGA